MKSFKRSEMLKVSKDDESFKTCQLESLDPLIENINLNDEC